MAERVQLRRTKGWRKPEGAVVVARPSRWGNPYRIREGRTAAQAVARYRLWLLDQPELIALVRAELAGRDLACWCRLGAPCHAEVLLWVANAPRCSFQGEKATESWPGMLYRCGLPDGHEGLPHRVLDSAANPG